MHCHAKSQTLLSRCRSPGADYIAMGTDRSGIPWLMLRVPGVEAVMVIGQSDEYLRACIFVARNQLVRVPVQQGPLCAKILVSEPRRRTEMFKLIFVLALVLDIHVAGVPVPGFGDALRTPVSPNAELGILVPIRRFVLEQRIPGGFEWTIACKIRDWRPQRHIIPKPACDRLRYRVVVPRRRLPCRLSSRSSTIFPSLTL